MTDDVFHAAVDPVRLDRLAATVVNTGLRLQSGQDLYLTAPVEALPLVRLVAKHAYLAGAGVVTPLIADAETTLMRFRHGRGGSSLDAAADWLWEGVAKGLRFGTARLGILGEDPMLLAGLDPESTSRAEKSYRKAYHPVSEAISGSITNWSMVACPTPAWAKRVFPDDIPHDALRKLAEAVFAACRVNGDDPGAEWRQHNANLARRAKWLTEHNFEALHYRGPGVDLTVGIAEQHAWRGGETTGHRSSLGDFSFNANLPTEEVFTTPHRLKTFGHVRSTRPFSLDGALIDGVEVRFEEGRVVEARATRGESEFLRLLDTDEGARRLGEMALVPNSSPISQSGVLFNNTLFDENAASHLAFGVCYTKCFVDGPVARKTATERGGNDSMIHVDWMIGSGRLDVDGVTREGGRVPVMRDGEWAEAV